MATVLLLEDDAGLRFTFAQTLEDAGHTVISVADNDAALAQLRKCTPDVLLLDLMINGAFSTDVADYAGYAAPDAAVIYVTGSGLFPKGELFRMSRNARWVLRKPVDLGDLANMVEHACAQASVKPPQLPLCPVAAAKKIG